jgi:hypothetical protein
VSTIVIGDVHGCIEELDELIRLVDPHRSHRLVFAGDLMDRGPDPAGVVRRVRELRAECVMGNHDEKHVRWGRHQQKAAANPDYRNPMRPLSPEGLAQHAALRSDDLEFLAALPLTIDLGDGWFVAHAGAAPNRTFAKQKPAVLLRCRWVDESGAMISQALRPESAKHWAQAWRGPEHIIYGHHVHDRQNIKIDRTLETTCVGIDTGCCFGGQLTAYVLETGEVAQVPARREYAKLLEGDDA